MRLYCNHFDFGIRFLSSPERSSESGCFALSFFNRIPASLTELYVRVSQAFTLTLLRYASMNFIASSICLFEMIYIQNLTFLFTLLFQEETARALNLFCELRIQIGVLRLERLVVKLLRRLRGFPCSDGLTAVAYSFCVPKSEFDFLFEG